MQIDHNVWLVLLFNITLILAFSWVSYNFIKCSKIYFKTSECNSTISLFAPNVSGIFANRYLIIRRMIKIDTDDDPLHSLLWLQA